MKLQHLKSMFADTNKVMCPKRQPQGLLKTDQVVIPLVEACLSRAHAVSCRLPTGTLTSTRVRWPLPTCNKWRKGLAELLPDCWKHKQHTLCCSAPAVSGSRHLGRQSCDHTCTDSISTCHEREASSTVCLLGGRSSSEAWLCNLLLTHRSTEQANQLSAWVLRQSAMTNSLQSKHLIWCTSVTSLQHFNQTCLSQATSANSP